VIDAPPLPPPTIVAPAPREVSFGRVSGTVPAGTTHVIVRARGLVVAEFPVRRRSFTVNPPLPTGNVVVEVTAVDGRNRRSRRSIAPVLSLPPPAAPLVRAPVLDRPLAAWVDRLRRQYGGTTGIYVENLRTGRGAAWNAGARFPAASTLKLAIAVTVLRALDGKPAAGSEVARLLGAMMVFSHNEAANDLEVWLAGSTSAGSSRVNETMRAIGLTDSEMYGGYGTRGPSAAAPIPIRLDRQPDFGVGKYTTAADLSRLARAVYLAAVGKGPLGRLGVDRSEARYLLWLLSQASDRGKLDRIVGAKAIVMHKSGWLPMARHDAGIVAYSGGAYVATVMTWQTARADELAGDVASRALARFTQ
jgi:beta-lactamase class A